MDLEILDGVLIVYYDLGQSLENLGYSGNHHFQQAYSYIYDLRDKYGADWGFVAFILHGWSGQMFDGFYAYARLGGPFNANVYSNGPLGPAKLDRVIAHEMGHNFYTLDEYPNNYCTCASRSGYLNAENANQQAGGSGCKINVPCVMRGASQPTPFDELEPCYYTKGQVGWWDSDEDGIPDILDVDPLVRSVIPDTAGAGALVSGDTLFTTDISFKGTVEAVPIPNLNPYSMVREFDFTVEPVRAEYRVNGGDWRPCEATDGRFDDPVEGYRFALTDLELWACYTVDVRAVTAHGNVTPSGLIESSRWYIVPASPKDPHFRLASSSPSNLPVYIDFSPAHASGGTGIMVRVEIAVYDAMGRKLCSLERGDFETGKLYSTEWNGSDANGELMPAGVYFLGMSSNGRLRTEKIVVIP